MTDTPDRLDELLAAARAGDQDAYRQFLSEAAMRLRSYAARRIGQGGDVEDVVQQCLIALHEKRGTLDPARPVGPWMYAIARYKLADAFRQQGRRPLMAELEDVPVEADTHAAHDVRALLGQLPEAQAEAIRMTRVEGLTMDEASARSGVGVSALKLRVHRGMARLKALVREGEA